MGRISNGEMSASMKKSYASLMSSIDIDIQTKNDAKCSDVITALKPTTGTKEARSVPKTTCIEQDFSRKFNSLTILITGNLQNSYPLAVTCKHLQEGHKQCIIVKSSDRLKYTAEHA